MRHTGQRPLLFGDALPPLRAPGAAATGLHQRNAQE